MRTVWPNSPSAGGGRGENLTWEKSVHFSGKRAINTDSTEAAMGQVPIRNVPDEVIEAHRRRAKALGHSLEQELRTIIEAAATYSTAEKLTAAEWAQSLTPPSPQTDAAALIREDRDR
jgi:plasmid stability protein